MHDGMYAPYGEVYSEAGLTSLRNFTGQEANLALDLYDFSAREYHPIQGRWIQPDPAGLGAVDYTNPQSWNRYGYVLGNPLANVDPSGMLTSAGGGGSGGGGFNGGSFGSENPCVLALELANNQPDKGYWTPSPSLGSCFGMTAYNGPLPGGGGGGGGGTTTQAPPKNDHSSVTRAPWLNNLYGLFGYDQRIPLRSCWGYAWSQLADNANPFTFYGPTFAADVGANVGSRVAFNSALKRMATMPDRKFANLFKDFQVKQLYKLSTDLEEGAPLVGFLAAGIPAFISEMKLASAGGCQ